MINILNESYFDDIEVKDEDLTDEEPDLTLKEYNEKTSKKLIKSKISESEIVLMIEIHMKYFKGQFNIWHRIERIMKRLKYMFNIYNINLSEPFITYEEISYQILKNKKFPDKEENYTIIQHEGCNLYFPEDKLREYGPDKTLKNGVPKVLVFLDKKLPVFKTARSAYNFLIGLDKCLWKDITVLKDDCFRWCDFFYDIDNAYNGNEIFTTFSFKNSYIHNDGTWIYDNVLKLVPEELAKQLENIKLSNFSDKDIKKKDLENIIKMMNQ